jgi:hypothetical protein
VINLSPVFVVCDVRTLKIDHKTAPRREHYRGKEANHSTIIENQLMGLFHTMLKYARLVVSLTLVTSVSSMAYASDNPDYDQCILHSLANSQSNFAARALSDSCDALYRNGAMLLPREKSYHLCVLQNVQAVRGAFAVNEILHACRRQNRM